MIEVILWGKGRVSVKDLNRMKQSNSTRYWYSFSERLFYTNNISTCENDFTRTNTEKVNNR